MQTYSMQMSTTSVVKVTRCYNNNTHRDHAALGFQSRQHHYSSRCNNNNYVVLSVSRRTQRSVECLSKAEESPDVVESGKSFIEAAQAAVTEEGEKVRAAVIGAGDDAQAGATEQGAGIKEKFAEAVDGALETNKSKQDEAVKAIDSGVETAKAEGASIQDKVTGAVDGLLESAQADAAKAQEYLKDKK